MKRRTDARSAWLPLAKGGAAGDVPTGEAFRTEWIDFDRGLRVGRLEPHERITRILKHYLEGAYAVPFVTDRWGRGVYWQWICWLPRPNREAKPLSSGVNFGCAKLFITVDQEAKVFKSGLQIERGYAEGPEPYPGCLLKADWDWHRLMAGCAAGTAFDREMRRLIGREGFVAETGNWEANAVFNARNFRSSSQVRRAAAACGAREWAGFQLYFPMSRREVQSAGGYEFVRAVCGVFDAVVPAMNACMQVGLAPRPVPPFVRG